jgi:hypothetical protein
LGRGLCKPTLETMHGGTCLLYMKYSPIGISPDQAQFLETRKFQIDEIARIFRVPPHMIGDLEKSTFSNIEQQSLEFVKIHPRPLGMARWEQAMSQSLLTPEERTRYEIHFNVDGLLRGDYESRMNGYAVGRQNVVAICQRYPGTKRGKHEPDPGRRKGGDLYLINRNWDWKYDEIKRCRPVCRLWQ